MLEYYERVVVQRKVWVGEFIAVFRRIPERFVCAPPLGRRDVAFTLIDGVPVSDFSERNHVNRSGDEYGYGSFIGIHQHRMRANARQRFDLFLIFNHQRSGGGFYAVQNELHQAIAFRPRKHKLRFGQITGFKCRIDAHAMLQIVFMFNCAVLFLLPS